MNSNRQVSVRLASIIFIAQSFFSASTIAAFTLSPIISVYLSGNESSAGIPNTLVLIGRAAFAYPFGLLMDRFGRRFALTNGYFISVIGGILSILAIVWNSYLFFLIGSFLLGMSRSSGDQSRFIVAEIFPTKMRATVIGAIVFAGTIGSVLGPLLVPASRRWVQPFDLPADSGPFFISSALMLLASLTVFFFLRPDPQIVGQAIAKEEAAENNESVESNATPRSWQTIFSQPMVQLALLSMVIGFFVMTFVMVITPVHINHGMAAHMDDNQMASSVSRVIMFHTLGMFGLSIFSGLLIDFLGRLNMILAGAIILAISCIVSPLASNILMLSVGLFLLGLGWNFAFVAGSSLFSDALASHERGRMQGIAETIVSISSGAASLVVGLIFKLAGYNLINIIGFILSAILIWGVYYFPRQNRQQNLGQIGVNVGD